MREFTDMIATFVVSSILLFLVACCCFTTDSGEIALVSMVKQLFM